MANSYKSVKSVFFSGVRFDQYSIDDLVDYLFCFKHGYICVVTPNVDHVVRANKDSAFNSLYKNAEISVNDSRVLYGLCKLINVNLGGVVPGSELTKAIIERIAGKKIPITIIGASDSTVAKIKKLYSLTDVTHYNPPMGFINDSKEVEKCVDVILSGKSKFVFLAVGSPRQEMLAMRAKNSGSEGIFLCIGASLLFLSGEEKRAPKIFQKLSLEWLYRLIQSPRRLAKRYLLDGLLIFPILFRERAMLKKNKVDSSA